MVWLKTIGMFWRVLVAPFRRSILRSSQDVWRWKRRFAKSYWHMIRSICALVHTVTEADPVFLICSKGCMYFDLKKKEFCFFKGPMENAHIIYIYIYIHPSMNLWMIWKHLIYLICNHRQSRKASTCRWQWHPWQCLAKMVSFQEMTILYFISLSLKGVVSCFHVQHVILQRVFRNVVCCGLHEFGPYKHFTVLDWET